MSSAPSASSHSSAPSPDLRIAPLKQWLGAQSLRLQLDSLRPASADASFRRYFRVDVEDSSSLIVMDAPPDKEDCRPFIQVAQLLRDAGLHAPQVLAQDLTQGFLLLTDLGNTTYLQAMQADATQAHRLFLDAIDALVQWQAASRADVLPPYDAALLRRELDLFPDWYVGRHLQHSLNDKQRQILETSFRVLIDACLAQPRVYVHRDYMPRNLMISEPNPGILDFQDAVYGPITYDIVSLMRDAFLSWEEEQVLDWTVRYWEKARARGLPVAEDFGSFYRDFEWMGLQRHLKVLGIFARINYRDGKPHYLADTPRFTRYVRSVVQRYGVFKPLAQLFDELEGVAQNTGFTF